MHTHTHTEFASVCRQSTEFHFPNIDHQLAAIQENAVLADATRSDEEMVMSSASTSSGSPPSQDMSHDSSESGLVHGDPHVKHHLLESSSMNESTSTFSPRPITTPTSPYMSSSTLGNGLEQTAGTGVWSGGRTEEDKKSATLQPGIRNDGEWGLTKH